MTACPTCEKSLKKVTSRHRPQLRNRSRTCSACNAVIARAEAVERTNRAVALVESWAAHGFRPCCAGLERDLRAGRETPVGVAEHMNDYITRMAREALALPPEKDV